MLAHDGAVAAPQVLTQSRECNISRERARIGDGMVCCLAIDATRHRSRPAPPGRNRPEMTQFTVRLRKLESRANSGYNTRLGNGEIWIELRDGRMRGRDGTILPREQFEQRRLRRIAQHRKGWRAYQTHPPRIEVGHPDGLMTKRLAFSAADRPGESLESGSRAVKCLLRRQRIVSYSSE